MVTMLTLFTRRALLPAGILDTLDGQNMPPPFQRVPRDLSLGPNSVMNVTLQALSNESR